MVNDDEFDFSDIGDDERWREGRLPRADAFISKYQDSMNSNLKALELLREILHESNENIRIGRKNVIVIGDLASYVISVRSLIERFHNVYSSNAHSGFPRVDIHPCGRWVRNPSTACLQVDSPLDMPSVDSLIGLLLGLMNDKTMFGEENLKQLRIGLISTYGFSISPISEVLAEFLESKYGVTHDIDNRRFVVRGTDGWTWYFDYSDPEVNGFRLLSSFRDGPVRVHVEDTSKDLYFGTDLEDMAESFSQAPRYFVNKLNRWTSTSMELMNSVAEYWAPLRRALTEIPDDKREEEYHAMWEGE